MCKNAWSKPLFLLRLLRSSMRARSVRLFYDAVADDYEAIFHDHLIHIDTIETLLCERYPDKPQTKVLDLACGTGLLSRRLARQGFSVIGLDLSARSLEHLRRSGANVPAIQGNAENLPFTSNSLQAIVCLGAWRHFGDAERVLDEVCRTLTPSGDLIIGYFPPKLGGLVAVPHGIFGRLAGAFYSAAVRSLGYTDLVDPGHEEKTIELLHNRSAEVQIIPSGTGCRLIHARTPHE